MSASVADLIERLEGAYHIRCNHTFLSEQFSGGCNIEQALAKLCTIPLKNWTENSNRIPEMLESKTVDVDTLLEIHTARNISESGTVSLLKPSSTAKLFLTDGYYVSIAILMKGFHTDLRGNIGKKLLIKRTGNTVVGGVLLLRNYTIMNQFEQMEVESAPSDQQQADQDDGSSNQ